MSKFALITSTKKSGPIAVTLLWLAVLAWLVPSRVILRGDDFGYVDSVVSTVRAQRWVPSDWLEPLDLPLTTISATCFALTHNFYVSTLGLSLLLAFANFILLGIYLRPAIPSDLPRWLIVLGLSLSPMWLHKTFEFTGLQFGISCTLAAWLCWKKGWRAGFFACVILGFLNRQSALCLLAWPVVEMVRQWFARRSVNWNLVIGTLIALGVAFLSLRYAPSTWAREISSAQLRSGFSPMGSVANLALAMVVLAGCQAGWGMLIGDSLDRIWRVNLSKPIIPLLCMSLGVVLVLGRRANILWETPGMDRFSLLVLTAATMLGAWFNRWDRRLPPEVLVFVGGYVLLVCLRGRWWEYYFFEPILALMYAPSNVSASNSRPAKWVWALLAVGLVSTLLFKYHLRKMEEKTVAFEHALRSGEVRIAEISDAPFGFMGWKLFATARGRPDAENLIDFMKYVEGSRAKYADGAIVVNREGGRKSIHPSGERWILPAGYIERPMPLNNEEWRAYISNKPSN